LVLAGAGATIVLMARSDSDGLRSAASACAQMSGARAVVCDSSDGGQIRSAYREIRSEFGRVDILVNNAGILEDALLGMISEEMIDRIMSVNAVGPILHMQAAARLMRKTGGSIINVSSIIGRVGNAGQVVYGASKAAVIGMTLSAAKEMASRGIRVNAIAPGFIGTDMTAVLPPEKYAERVDAIAMGRVGTPEDVARVVLFLASDMSGYVSGQVIGVDGGMLI